MKKLALISYVLMIVVLAATTFIEKYHGSTFVSTHIYHSGWFIILWGLLALSTLIIFQKKQLWKRLPVFLLHASFLVILSGALVTYLFGQKGYIHLIKGEDTTCFVESDSREIKELPFSLKLDSFRIKYYPGTEAPADYISSINGYDPISMNRILQIQGYRFYQSSFDENGNGSWLSVNYDPWGITLTYIGYGLLFLSMLWLLIDKRESFRKLLQHNAFKQSMPFLITLFLCGCSNEIYASDRPLPALNRQQADSLSITQVIYNDRVVPFNTLARDFVLKITGDPTYKGLTPEQVVGGWLLRPEVWKEEPMIYIKNKELCQRLGIQGKYARLTDLFNEGNYRLKSFYVYGDSLGQSSSRFMKSLIELDEKVGLILMLQNGTLIRPLPTDGSVAPLSKSRLQAELWYNRIPFSKILFMFCLTIGFLSFFYTLYRSIHSSSPPCRWLEKGWDFALYAALLFHLTGYGLRWYIAGRIPLSNGYETMLFMALCALSVALLLHKRFRFMLSFGLLLAGFTLLVSYLGQKNPQITPLMPVLVSPWLSTHVSFIMLSYTLFAFMALNGVVALCNPAESHRLMLFSRMMLYPAVFLLGTGIFIGAIWANVSWGRYWAWDPKEVWALITFMLYGLAFHQSSYSSFRNTKFFHTYMLVSFLAILMTYFGVNYFLGGLHSY